MQPISKRIYRPALQRLVIFLVAGIYGVTFFVHTATAVTSETSCGVVCCCKQMSQHGSMLSSQPPSSGCCSGNRLPACNLQDGVSYGFPESALHITHSPGKRLLSDVAASNLSQSEQQLQSKVFLQSETIANLQSVPLYLQTSSLLC